MSLSSWFVSPRYILADDFVGYDQSGIYEKSHVHVSGYYLRRQMLQHAILKPNFLKHFDLQDRLAQG